MDGKARLLEVIKEANKDEMMQKTKNTILLNISYEVLIEVIMQKDARYCGNNFKPFMWRRL